ncbi:MAG: hypothetical protein JW818_13835, partial [Pirellulales bacterium]|nr:hypothetical protein [Pirellulales bacterium]
MRTASDYNSRTRWSRLGRALAAIALVAITASGVFAQTAATWTGGAGTSSYDTPANWDIGVVPTNNGTTYNVFIPDAMSVLFDVDGPATVTDLNLGANATLTISPGEQLNVDDDARIAGLITTAGGIFQAVQPGAQFTNNLGRLYVSGGGQIAVAAPTYSSTGMNAHSTTYDLFVADGANSTINLSTVQNFNAGFNDNHGYVAVHRILATAAGHVNLSGVQTLTAPVRGEDHLDVILRTGGTVDLSALQSITSASEGYVRLDLDTGSTLSLPSLLTADRTDVAIATGATINAASLQSLSRATVSLVDGATFSAPSLTSLTYSTLSLTPLANFTVDGTTGLTNLDNTRLSVSGGRQFGTAWGEIGATGYSATGLNSHSTTYDLFTVDGAGSVLDLSSLQSINAGFNDNHSYGANQRFYATAGGHLDLSGVQTITSPVRGEDHLDIFTQGGTIDLSSLQTITSASSGYTDFQVEADTTTSLPSLAAVDHIDFRLGTSATLNVPSLVSHTTGEFRLEAGATVNAGNLESVSNVAFTLVDGSAFHGGKLSTLTNCSLSLTPLTTFTVSSTTGLTNLNNTRLAVSAGKQFGTAAGEITATTYSSTGLTAYNTTHAIFTADSEGTVLDLSSLQTLNAGFNDNTNGYTTVHRILAQSGAAIDLSGVQTITAPYLSQDRLDVVTQSGGTIDLTGLQTINTSGSGYVRFDVEPATTTNLPALAGADHLKFDVAAGAAVNLPVLVSHNAGYYSLAAGAAVHADDLQTLSGITFTLADGSTFDAPSLHTLTNGVVSLTPLTTFTVAPTTGLTNLNHTRIAVSGGRQFGTALGQITATSYTSTSLNDYNMTHTLFLAEGPGSVLDLSSLESINAGFHDNTNSYVTVHRAIAQNGASIDLSGVRTITAPYLSQDRFDVVTQSGGTIDLTGLESTGTANSGYTRFSVESGTTTNLPVLATADHLQFNLDENATVNLPSLVSHDSGHYQLQNGATVQAGELLSMSSVNVTLADTATLNAPKLTSLTYGVVSLGASSVFNVDPTVGLTNINQSRFAVTGGQQFGSGGEVSATSYSASTLNAYNTTHTLFSS